MLGDAGEDACNPAILPVRPTMLREPGSGEWLNERRGEQWRFTGYMACADCVDEGLVHSVPGLSPRLESSGDCCRPAMPSTPASDGFLSGGGR